MKKIQSIIYVLILALAAGAFFMNSSANSKIASAHHDEDTCNQTYTYEKTSDYNDSKVTIDFINTQASGNPDSINVSADSGYQLESVYLDVDNDNQNGYVNYTNHFPGQYNPNGEDINKVKVIVKKICATPTPTNRPTATPTTAPTVTPVPTTAPSITPSVTPVPETNCDQNETYNADLHICIQCNGGGTCEVNIGDVSPTPIPSEEPTATPTPTIEQPQLGGGDSGSSSNNSSSANDAASASSPVAIAPISYANTGVFEEAMSNLMLSAGAVLSGISLALYGAKKKTIQK
jgi:hypothetical protein